MTRRSDTIIIILHHFCIDQFCHIRTALVLTYTRVELSHHNTENNLGHKNRITDPNKLTDFLYQFHFCPCFFRIISRPLRSDSYPSCHLYKTVTQCFLYETIGQTFSYFRPHIVKTLKKVVSILQCTLKANIHTFTILYNYLQSAQFFELKLIYFQNKQALIHFAGMYYH